MHGRLIGAAALLCASLPLCAQTSGDAARGTLSASIGTVLENRRDASDSPVAYGGSGIGGVIEYDRTTFTRRRYFSLGGGAATLSPSSPMASPEIWPMQESFAEFALKAGMEWLPRSQSGRFGALALGVELSAGATIVLHHYPGLDTSLQSFDLGVASIAPTARWTRRLGSGTLAASLAVPLIAWVDHPYGDVRYATQAMRIRFAPPSQLHAADGSISYEFAAGNRTSVIRRTLW